MSPEEAKFLLEKDPATAASVASVALRHNEPMWRVLLEAGLPKAIRSKTSARRDLLERLLFVPEKENAVLVLNGVLSDMKKAQQQSLLANVRGGEVIVSTWMRNCTEFESVGPQRSEARFVGEKQGLDILMSCLSSRGLDVNPVFKGSGNHGRAYAASPLREALSRFMHENLYPLDRYAIPAAQALFRHGAKLDDATKQMVMGCSTQSKVLDIVSAMEAAGLVKHSEWLTSPSKSDKAENIALVQSLMAKDQIAAIQAKAKIAPA